MIATSHVIIGGAAGLAVGALTQNPAAALAAGIVSHLIADAIPHLDAPFRMEYENGQHDRLIWTKRLFRFALADSLVAFSLTFFLWFKYFHLALFAPFAWGAFGGYLPDLIDVAPFWKDEFQSLPIFKQFHQLHFAMNFWRFKFPMPDYWILGTATQIIIIIPCLWYILK